MKKRRYPDFARGQTIGTVIIIILMLVLFIFIPALNEGTVGIMVPVGVILTLIEARVMYKKGLLFKKDCCEVADDVF